MSKSKSVLWWGRFDPDYSRNRVLRQAFRRLGWDIVDFRPINSMTGDLEAYLRNIKRPDLVWVPSFRQRDVAAARRWADKSSVQLVFDPLISAYDKQVNERQLLKKGSFRARRLLCKEKKLFQAADFLAADTCAHAEFFRSDFAVPEQDIFVVPVGAEEGLFQAIPAVSGRATIEVLFYGTFIDLQGPQVIVEAASICKVKNVAWTLLGEGPLRQKCEEYAVSLGLNNLSFEDWVAYESLPERIGKADILLGAFGKSGKASRVIPNKVYQSLACGRPVVTRRSDAYPEILFDKKTLGLIQIEPDSAEDLAETVERFASNPEMLMTGSQEARQTYEAHFSSQAIIEALHTLLNHKRI